MHETFAQTRYGRIHYVEAGVGAPILLTHSGGSSLYEFDLNFKRLARMGRVIAWDLPGHGDSAPFTADLSVEDYTAAAIALLDALSIERAHFVGASIGGFMAMELGASHPERVDKLVIVDTQLRTKQWWVQNWAMVEGMFCEVAQPYVAVAPRFKALSPEVYRRWNIDRAKAGARSMMGVVWAAREFDAMGQAAKVKRPVMTMLGGVGPSLDCADDFCRLLPHGRLEIVAGCGHFPMIDEPEIFVDLLADFLELREA
jgi:3-oxoadipate enol-lactonase